MTKYKATRYATPEIYPVEVQSETEHFVVLPDCLRKRVAKRGDYESYHDSFDDAKEYLIVKQEEKVHGLKKEFIRAQKVLREINSMKENGNEY